MQRRAINTQIRENDLIQVKEMKRERERDREGGREEDLNNTSKRSKNNILTKGVTEGIILDRIYWQRRIHMTVFD